MQKITVSQFKRALAAAAKVDAKRPNRRGAATSPRLLSLRQAMDERLATQSAETESDTKSLDRARREYDREMRRIMDKEQADAAKRSSKVEETLRLAAQSRFEAVKYLGAGLGYPTMPNTLLDKPFLIWATPHSNILWDSLIVPGHSWAKIKVDHEWKSTGFDKLIFYYLWENESDNTIVVNVSAYLTMYGFCRASASLYKTDPSEPYPGDHAGWANLDLSANLALMEWWNQPPTITPLQNSPDQHGRYNVLAWRVTGWDYGKVETVVNGCVLNQNLVVLPPRGVLVIEVSINVDHDVGHGSVLADFESEGYQITSPWVHLAYVSAPPLTLTPPAPTDIHP